MLKTIIKFFNKKEIERKVKNKNELKENEYVYVKIHKSNLEDEELSVEYKLAHLILEEEVFCNNGWWYKKEGIEWKEDAVSLHVNCNDFFYWGCADAEELLYHEISDLYKFWTKDKVYGSLAWCVKKRKQRPQPPVEKEMIKRGYDIDSLINTPKDQTND